MAVKLTFQMLGRVPSAVKARALAMSAEHPHTARMTPHPLDPLAPEELAPLLR
ncbi:MAG: hypothetical protein ACKOSO_01920 [Actinomycetota bacterium]